MFLSCFDLWWLHYILTHTCHLSTHIRQGWLNKPATSYTKTRIGHIYIYIYMCVCYISWDVSYITLEGVPNTIHSGSCARLTSNSFHSRPVVWNHMVTVHYAVQPQLYGTIWNYAMWNLRPIFIVSHLHNDMWLLFNRDIHWLTLRLEQP